jgi:hypothetical protein
VEESTIKEIEEALLKKVPMREMKEVKKERRKILVPKQIVKAAKDLEGTLEAILLNEKMKQTERMPVSELAEKLQQANGVDTIVFDGVITQRLIDIADERKIKYLVAARVSDAVKQPLNVHLLTFADIQG